MKGFSSSRPFLLLPGWTVKVEFSEVFQLVPVQTGVLRSPKSAPGWAESAKQVAMQQVARETWVAFERRLERAQVPVPQRPDYHLRQLLRAARVAGTGIRAAGGLGDRQVAQRDKGAADPADRALCCPPRLSCCEIFCAKPSSWRLILRIEVRP